MPGWVNTLFAYLVAAVAGGMATSIFSTQVALLYLSGAGADIPMDVRGAATLTDLTGFAPTLVMLTAIGFVIALPVAALVSRRIGGLRTFGYVLAGFVTIVVMVTAITVFYQSVLGTRITPVATSRDLWGLVIISLGGAIGGWLFALLTPRRV